MRLMMKQGNGIVDKYGRIAYETHCIMVGAKSEWEEVPDSIKFAWSAIASNLLSTILRSAKYRIIETGEVVYNTYCNTIDKKSWYQKEAKDWEHLPKQEKEVWLFISVAIISTYKAK